jgi:hypothetical protein
MQQIDDRQFLACNNFGGQKNSIRHVAIQRRRMESHILHSDARKKARTICMVLLRMLAAQKPEQEQATCSETKSQGSRTLH